MWRRVLTGFSKFLAVEGICCSFEVCILTVEHHGYHIDEKEDWSYFTSPTNTTELNSFLGLLNHRIILCHRKCHCYPDGTERPIAGEPCYQVNVTILRRALSLVFGTQKFHQYISGRQFTLITDHRPLTTILLKEIFHQWLVLLDCNALSLSLQYQQSHMPMQIVYHAYLLLGGRQP